MSDHSPLDYYAKRARQEQERAEKASDPCVRLVHRQMADTYRQIVESGEIPEPRTRPNLAPMRD